ncbi:unnamed protein product [Hermetia illucens]|uniref:Chitin-binding type-2 domain-containing protein n=1 Tax=Hermetia illucens TaxID=343691 RepID=A0A7R8UGG9_HERIL|nr:peritrophin-1-like [Hermetia illucens]CAD7080443.1 unnamed protein product [Hermetia illucens]
MKIVLITLALIVALASGQTVVSPSICYGQANGFLTANPNNAYRYYVCSNGVPVPVQCPNGLIFCSFQSNQACSLSCSGSGVTSPTPTPTIPTAPTPSANDSGDRDADVCSNLSNGMILPISGTCSGYIMCKNGKSVVGQCVGNKAFNQSTGACSETLCS